MINVEINRASIDTVKRNIVEALPTYNYDLDAAAASVRAFLVSLNIENAGTLVATAKIEYRAECDAKNEILTLVS